MGIRKPLKQFSRQLGARAAQSRELPTLLSELGDLQNQALTAQRPLGGSASVGLLGRLFGRRERANEITAKPNGDSSAFPAEPAESLQGLPPVGSPETPEPVPQPDGPDSSAQAAQALQAAIDIAEPQK